MSIRLQVLIPPELNAKIRKSAGRRRQSLGAFVRQALEREVKEGTRTGIVAELSSYRLPVKDVDEMIRESTEGRWE